MSCNQVPFALLMRLADGELRGLKALTLRRHLKHCPECTQTLSELGRIDTLLKSTDHFPTETRQRGALPLRPIGLVSGIALAAGAALLFVVPGGPLRPTHSFAQVEAAMEKIQTVHWTETTEAHMAWSYSPNGTGRAVASDQMSRLVHDCWGDLVGRKLSQAQISGAPEGTMGWRVLVTVDQAWIYMKLGNYANYTRVPAHTGWGANAPKLITEQVVLPRDDPGRTETRSIGEKETQSRTYLPWRPSPEEREGKKLLRFDRTIQITHGTSRTKREVTVWVDPITMRVVRREELERQPNSERIAFRRFAEGFRYNEAPPAGVFELPLPRVGESFRFVDLAAERRNSKANAEAARALIPQVLDAYSKRDTDRFLAFWDWDAVGQENVTKLQAQWRKAVQEHTPYKTWRYGALTSGFAGRVLYQRKSETDPFPPTYAATDAVLGAWVTTEKNARPTLAEAVFSLTKRSGQWKIQNLTLSKDPLSALWLKGKH